MKIRNGFVSNSSSSSFVLKWSELSKSEKKEIEKLTESSDSLTRCTGYIAPENLENWLKELDEIYSERFNPELNELIKENKIDGKNDLVLIRESDEGMGGEFNGDLYKISQKAILEFEYH